MAAVKRGRAVSAAEDAVRLLRKAGFSFIALHWLGSIPFALGLLLFWSALTRGNMTNAECAEWSLAIAILYLSMNCWRAVFAGRLRRVLQGAPPQRATAAALARLVITQSFLGALKLVVWPFSLLIGFPFARTIAFLRYGAALSAREDLDGPELIAHAHRLSALEGRLNWAILPIQWLIGFAVTANLALALAILPTLIRMLTGYESAFSRGQEAFTSSPLFFIVSLLAGWLAFDPFVQAIYCVRCFESESLETGEDLRSRLRRLRAPAAAILAIAAAILLARPLLAASSISAGDLQQAVQKAMQAPEYSWRLPKAPETGFRGTPWVIAVTERILHAGAAAIDWISRAVSTVLRWLFGHLGVSPESEGGAAPRTAIHWSVYLLIAVAAIAILLFSWRKQIFRRRRHPAAALAESAPIQLEDENVSADRLPESRWLEMAASLLHAENFRLALRAFYLANLAWLGQGRWLTIDAGKTNREYEIELQRRARDAAEARALFAQNIAAFEQCWYGMHRVAREDVEAFQTRSETLKESLGGADFSLPRASARQEPQP